MVLAILLITFDLLSALQLKRNRRKTMEMLTDTSNSVRPAVYVPHILQILTGLRAKFAEIRP
jgi:hypothetical protein